VKIQAKRLLYLLPIIAIVSACGSSAKSTSSNTTAAAGSSSTAAAGSSNTAAAGSSNTAAASGTPIKVGFLCTCSGSFGPDGVTSEDVFRAWVDSTNASGGINGHHLQFYFEDDHSIPGTAVAGAQALISDKVDVIADATVLDGTWQTEAEAAHIPVACIVISQSCYSSPDFYPQGQTANSSVYAAVQVAKEAGATNLAYVYCVESPVCASGIPILQSSGKQLGVPLVYKAAISASAPNYTAQCIAAEQQHVSAIFVADSQPPLEELGVDCSKQGYDPIYVSEGTGFGLGQATSPGIDKNLWSEYSEIPFWANTPATQKMNAALDKYYPGLRTNQQIFSQTSVNAWPAGLLIGAAVQGGNLSAGETPSPAEITAGLESLHGETLGGFAPPLTFAAGQGHSINCWFTAHVANGVPQLSNNGKATCGSLAS
jgi:branched-chain amino acid transport system substrate-binding protein